MAAVLVIARLCEPSSELHIAEDWFRRTALDDLLGLPEAKVNDDRLYRALDRLLPHKDALEEHLKDGSERCSSWNTICCCTTSPAPTSRARPTATAGRSAAIRATIGPTASRSASVWSSPATAFRWATRSSPATATTTTVQEIVKRMEERYGRAGGSGSWIAAWSARQPRVAQGTRLALHRRHAQGGVEAVRAGVAQGTGTRSAKVWRCSVPDEPGRRRSSSAAAPTARQGAGDARAVRARIEKGLQAIVRSCEQKRCDPGVIERRVGRLLGKNTRAARLFTVRSVVTNRGAWASRGRGKRRQWSRRSVARAATCCGAT